jgi:methionyl-tRNA formyltransferase
MHPYVFVGGVDISHTCLETLCELGLPPALAVGYDANRARASGYRDLGDLAARYDFELVRAPDINDPALVERIEKLQPKLLYVLGWSQLIKPRLLEIPAHGAAGTHPTRLPEGRGRAPIPWTIIKGLERTACTLFLLREGVDDGPIVGQVEFDVDPRETAATLYDKHRQAHIELIRTHTRPLLDGTAQTTEQDHERATFWDRRRPEDGRIDWTKSTDEIDRLIRAVSRPFPGAFDDERVIWRAEPAQGPEAPPGTKDHDKVATGDGWIRILESGELPDG